MGVKNSCGVENKNEILRFLSAGREEGLKKALNENLLPAMGIIQGGGVGFLSFALPQSISVSTFVEIWVFLFYFFKL